MRWIEWSRRTVLLWPSMGNIVAMCRPMCSHMHTQLDDRLILRKI